MSTQTLLLGAKKKIVLVAALIAMGVGPVAHAGCITIMGANGSTSLSCTSTVTQTNLLPGSYSTSNYQSANLGGSFSLSNLDSLLQPKSSTSIVSMPVFNYSSAFSWLK